MDNIPYKYRIFDDVVNFDHFNHFDNFENFN